MALPWDINGTATDFHGIFMDFLGLPWTVMALVMD